MHVIEAIYGHFRSWTYDVPVNYLSWYFVCWSVYTLLGGICPMIFYATVFTDNITYYNTWLWKCMKYYFCNYNLGCCLLYTDLWHRRFITSWYYIPINEIWNGTVNVLKGTERACSRLSPFCDMEIYVSKDRNLQLTRNKQQIPHGH
jgi:hypothetical protein